MSLAAAPTVFIIDPNEGSRSALGKLLQEAGRGVAAYDCAETFLARTSADHPGCLLLESQLPGAGDLHLMDELQRRGAGMPVLQRRGRGDLVTEITVETPTRLSKEQKAILEQFRETETGDECPESRGFFDKLKNAFGS